MALEAENVRSALTGAVYTAPVGTALPVTATATWNVAFTDLGYLSEDGITETRSDDWNKIRAWQNRTIVRSLLTGSDATFAFTLIETTRAGLMLVHPGSTVINSGGNATLAIYEPTENRRAFGIDVVDGTEHIRIVIPEGEVTEVGDIVYKNGEAIGYPLTITAYSDENGLVAYKYSDSDSWESA